MPQTKWRYKQIMKAPSPPPISYSLFSFKSTYRLSLSFARIEIYFYLNAWNRPLPLPLRDFILNCCRVIRRYVSVLNICLKNMKISLRNKTQNFRTSTRYFGGTSRGALLVPFGTGRWEVPYCTSHFSR